MWHYSYLPPHPLPIFYSKMNVFNTFDASNYEIRTYLLNPDLILPLKALTAELKRAKKFM